MTPGGNFTYADFAAFCRRAANMPVFTIADFLARTAPLARPFILLRFDVDYREPHALRLAQIAHQHRLRGSFYFRCHAAGFKLDTLHAVAALGHEVGYHFDALDRCGGDFDRAARLFAGDVARLRDAGLTIRTVAAHGSPPTAPTYRANRDLLARYPDLLAHTGLIGETTVSIDFLQVIYVSDAGWSWRRHAPYTPDSRGQPIAWPDVLRAVADPGAALYLNFHPHQWFARPLSAAYFRRRQRIGQRLLPPLRRLTRRVR